MSACVRACVRERKRACWGERGWMGILTIFNSYLSEPGPSNHISNFVASEPHFRGGSIVPVCGEQAVYQSGLGPQVEVLAVVNLQ